MNANSFKSIGPQSFLLPCPVFLVGTYSHEAQEDMFCKTKNDTVDNSALNVENFQNGNFTTGDIQKNDTGSAQEKRKPNIMTAAWGTLCSAQPPALLVAIRNSRHTHASILQNKAFTVNIPSTDMLAQVDYAGIFSAAHLNFSDKEDKVTQCELTAVAGEHVDAPYIQECPVVIELTLLQHHDVGTHTLFIGEIMDTKIKESCFTEESSAQVPHIKSLDIPCYVPLLREYWSMGEFQAKAFSVGKTMNMKK